MSHKKTFWMNVFFSVVWLLLSLFSFATDIDYVEHTQADKILTALSTLYILIVPIVTALHIYKSKSVLLRKLALFGNYLIVIGLAFSFLAIIYNQLSESTSMDFLYIFITYGILILPFLINLKALFVSK